MQLGTSFERHRARERVRAKLTATPTPVARLGRYEVLGVVGRGAMGVVYRARDEVLDRPVALKVVRLDPEQDADCWLAEARALAAVRHPNVVAVHDAGRTSDGAYIAMELIEGTTLDRWLELRRRSSREVIEVLMSAGRGLAAVHEAGIVHRDFKPYNVMVSSAGEVRVLDFGLCRSAHAVLPPDAHPEFTAPAGTPAYMAPEQRLGVRPTAASDQYAFCTTFHEALTGRRPDHSSWSRLTVRILKPILGRGLLEDPARRHPSMAALVRRFERRFRMLQVGTLGLAVAAGAAGGVTVWGS